MHKTQGQNLELITGTTVSELKSILSKKSTLYYSFQLPKSVGKTRTITPSKPPLKNIQYHICQFLSRIHFPSCVHGYVRGRDCYTNAQCHINKKWVITLDIQDFFPSCDSTKVHKALFFIGLDSHVVDMVTDLVIFEDKLPQGAPTSPIISNLVLGKLDTEFATFAKKHGLIYTRYADDITLSTNTEKVLDFKEALRNIIKTNDFKVNESKYNFTPNYQRQVVTGFVVNKYVAPTTEYIRALKRLIKACYHKNQMSEIAMNEGKTIPQLKQSILGKIAYIKHVDPKLAREIKDLTYPLKASHAEMRLLS